MKHPLRDIKDISARSWAWAAFGCLSVAGGFFTYGLEFGLMLVPLTVGIIATRRIHSERLQAKTEQIIAANSIHLTTIETLATAIDARDQIGSGHVRRTQIYALGLGEALGLSDEEMSALRTGSLLHDIGKLAVPDHILSKPDRLTPAELEKAKTHAAVGAAILSEIDFPYPVVPTVKFHHEFWDGSGYPHGLAGADIPITARILTIADTYDALRCDRPYRKAMTREEARKHIANGAGCQFDPHLVQEFLKNLNSFEATINRLGFGYSDSENYFTKKKAGFVEQIKLANREVFTLFELTRELGGSESLDTMLATFCERAREFVPFDTCSIFLLDDSKLVADVAHVDGKNRAVFATKQIAVGQGATGIVLKRREPLINVNPDLDFSFSQLELIQEYSTMASFPLIADGVLIGAVSVYTTTIEEYAEEHVRILETITEIAAGSIAKLQDHVQTREHALTDPMTELPNARSLQMHFDREVARANREDSNFQIVMMDLDGFKAVNDTFGHKVGDRMLREVGKVIQAQLREYDLLGRYGGDEFIALIPMATAEDTADLSTRIEQAVSSLELPVDETSFASVGISLGAASYAADGETFDQLIVAADKAMYKSKAGRKQQALAPEPMIFRDELAPSLGSMLSGLGFEDHYRVDSGFVVELDESAVVTSNAIN